MGKIIRFKITLRDSKPSIWRTFEVTDDYRLDHFHQVIQIVMGWNNAHLHQLGFDRQIYEMHMPDIQDGYEEGEDETKYTLRDLLLKEGNILNYLYDFGDSWDHRLLVEKIAEGNLEMPVCLAGERACPPEDCGGVWGYMEMMEALSNPKHPEYRHYLAWVPDGFDPGSFDLKALNRELKRFGMFRNENPDAKSTPWQMM